MFAEIFDEGINVIRKVGVKFYDLLLLTEWLKETLPICCTSIILALQFSKMLKFFRILCFSSFEDVTSSNFQIINSESDRLWLDAIL